MSTILCGISLWFDLFRKRIDQKKFPFRVATELYQLFNGLQNIFCTKFTDIPEKSQRGKKTSSKSNAKRCALQANKKNPEKKHCN